MFEEFRFFEILDLTVLLKTPKKTRPLSNSSLSIRYTQRSFDTFFMVQRLFWRSWLHSCMKNVLRLNCNTKYKILFSATLIYWLYSFYQVLLIITTSWEKHFIIIQIIYRIFLLAYSNILFSFSIDILLLNQHQLHTYSELDVWLIQRLIWGAGGCSLFLQIGNVHLEPNLLIKQ